MLNFIIEMLGCFFLIVGFSVTVLFAVLYGLEIWTRVTEPETPSDIVNREFDKITRP